MKTLQEIKQIIKENKQLAEEKYDIKIIGIFGSYARGEQTLNSDIDLLVEFKKPNGFQTLRAWDYFEELLEIKIDLVSAKYLKPKLREYIEKELMYV